MESEKCIILRTQWEGGRRDHSQSLKHQTVHNWTKQALCARQAPCRPRDLGNSAGDAVGDGLVGIVGKMRVSRGCLNLGMTEKLSDRHRIS